MDASLMLAAAGGVGTLAGLAGWARAAGLGRAYSALEKHHREEMHRMAEQQPIDEIVAQAIAAQAAHEQTIGAQMYDAHQRVTATHQRARRELHARKIAEPDDLRARIERLVR